MPAPNPLPPAALRGSLLEALRWLATLAAVLAAMIAAALVGLLLGVFGAAAAALVLVLALVLLAAGPGARAGLSIALIGAALATGATIAQLSPDRIAPSAGQLTVAPERAAELDGDSLRRGAGPVFVDLRRSELRDGERIRLKLRSDGGRVVVALPPGKCVNVELRARSGINTGLGGTVLAGLGSLGVDAANDRHTSLEVAGYEDPFRTATEDVAYWRQRDAAATTGIVWPAGHGVGLSGRSLRFGAVIDDASGELQKPPAVAGLSFRDLQTVPVQAERRTTDPAAPRLELDVTAAAAIAVRDYPLDVGPMTLDGGFQVGDMSWPERVQTPLVPEDRGWNRRWREDWAQDAKAREAHRQWISWERDVTRALHQKAKLAAGPCASVAERRAQWQTVRYGILAGSSGPEAGIDPDTLELVPEALPLGQPTRVIAVNALGEVVIRGDRGSRPASGSAGAIIGGTELRLRSDAEIPELRAERAALLTPEVIR